MFTCSSTDGNFRDPNPFSFEKSMSQYMTGTFDEYDYPWVYQRAGDGCGGGPLNAGVLNTAVALDPYNKCLDKLYGKLRSGVDLSIDIYQGKQTVRMLCDFGHLIAHPVQTIQETITRLLKDQTFVRSLKFAGGKWLEYQYGLKPTIDTIYSLTNELVGVVSSPDGCLKAFARHTTQADAVRLASNAVPKDGFKTTLACTQQRRCQIVLRCGIANEQLNSLSQFTSLNPLSFFYENIPFSFVVDWVWDVGGYLRMMETALATGLVFKSGFVTNTTRTDVHGSCIETRTDAYGKVGVSNLQGVCFNKTLQRYVLTSMPLPVFPAVSVNLGATRILSAAALLTNLLQLSTSKRR